VKSGEEKLVMALKKVVINEIGGTSDGGRKSCLLFAWLTFRSLKLVAVHSTETSVALS
jgi:hypothetical protein